MQADERKRTGHVRGQAASREGSGSSSVPGGGETVQAGKGQVTKSPLRHALGFGFPPEDSEKSLKDC